MAEEVDSRYQSVSQEVMDAALKSGNYVKGADGVVRDYFTGTEIRVRGVETNDSAELNDKIGADVASAEDIYQQYRDNGYTHEEALAASTTGLETVIGGGDDTSSSTKKRNNPISRNLKSGRFDIEAAIADYAKDRFLKGPTRKKRKIQDGILRYPLQALTSSTDYLQIDIGNYEPVGERYINTPGSSKRYVTSTSRGSSNSTAHLSTRPLINAGTILLPIPSQITDTNAVEYGAKSMNGLEAWAAGLGEDIMNIDWSDPNFDLQEIAQRQGQKALSEITTGVGNMEMAKTRMRKQLLGSALGIFGSKISPDQLLSRSTGEVLNPHMELLFSGPTIRNFNFAFKFTPRNELEAQQVKLIIRAFKQNMAPKIRGSAGSAMSGSYFLKTPNVFKIQYKSGNKNHPFLNKFKECFLKNVNTSYTADGVYTTYDDGTPTSMILGLSFTETEPIYDDDYDEGPGTQGVGY